MYPYSEQNTPMLEDPDTCEHTNLTKLKSTRQYVPWYCTNCCTFVERKPRGDANEIKNLAKQVGKLSTLTFSDRCTQE
eukprot:1635779-Karenia_brevis.AAC.1